MLWYSDKYLIYTLLYSIYLLKFFFFIIIINGYKLQVKSEIIASNNLYPSTPRNIDSYFFLFSDDIICRGCEVNIPVLGIDNKSLKLLLKHCQICPDIPRKDLSSPFACLKCDYSCSRKFNMSQHIRRHIGKSFVCHICSKSFTTKLGMKKHFKSHTGDLHTCTLCGLKKHSLAALYEHYAVSHGVNKSMKECPHCGEIFRRIDSFQRHLNHQHGKQKNN